MCHLERSVLQTLWLIIYISVSVYYQRSTQFLWKLNPLTRHVPFQLFALACRSDSNGVVHLFAVLVLLLKPGKNFWWLFLWLFNLLSIYINSNILSSKHDWEWHSWKRELVVILWHILFLSQFELNTKQRISQCFFFARNPFIQDSE